MTISLGNSIKGVTKDLCWKKKNFILGIICFISLLANGVATQCSGSVNVPFVLIAISAILYITLTLYLCGFIIKTINNTMQSDSFKLANFSDKNLMLIGLKYIVGSILFLLPVTIVLVLIIAILAFIGLVILKKSLFGILLMNVGFVILLVFFMLIFNVAYACFAKTMEIGGFVAFKKYFRIIKENQHKTWTLVGKVILLTLLLMLIMMILGVTVVGLLLVPFINIYTSFVVGNLLDQYAKEINLDKYLQG